MPKITVAVPVYNDGLYLREAIDSILMQTFTDFELLIIDDGSTDNCPEIIRSYTDPRIRVLTHSVNLGRPASRNDALEHARGEYLLWMDADDIALPELLAVQVDFLDNHPEIDISGVNLEYFNERDEISNLPTQPNYIKAHTLFAPCISNPACCFRLNRLKELKIRYDNQLLRAEDFGFWFTSQFIYNLKITSISKTLVRYRYFYRETNAKYHELVLKKYIFPFLHLDDNNSNIKLHAKIMLEGIPKTCQTVPVDRIIKWLNTFYLAGVRHLDKATAKELETITFSKIYECLSQMPLSTIIRNRKQYAFLEKSIFVLLGKIFISTKIKKIKKIISAHPKFKKTILSVYNKTMRKI